MSKNCSGTTFKMDKFAENIDLLIIVVFQKSVGIFISRDGLGQQSA